jgi:hypothetical protein
MSKQYQENFKEWVKKDYDTHHAHSAWGSGWEACKKEVLKILQQSWTGLDMSPNSCDQYYIDKVKGL